MNRSKNIKAVSSGILEGLESLNEEQPNSRASKVKLKTVITKELKFKRSYMLTQEQIKKVILIKAISGNKDYSEIVGAAIDCYYKLMKIEENE